MNGDSREEVVRPCLIVAHGDSTYTVQVSRAFRRLGWDVYTAQAGPEARRLARLLSPELLILATELLEESGWLTCEKILGEMPGAKVFLVGENHERNADFASFVGAVALLPQSHSVSALVEEICGRTLPAAG